MQAKQGTKDYEKKRTRTTSQAAETQQLLLAADAFAAALEAVPAEDWCRTWAAGRTIMLRRTSKRVKEVVDKMRLPAGVRLSRSFWDDARNGTEKAKLEFVFRQLAAMLARCLITTLELPKCEMKGQDAARLAEVLAQCPALAHFDLSGNSDFGAAGAERLAGVLGQCRELVHLNLSGNYIRAGGAERLAGVLGQCRELAHLDLGINRIGAGGAESLAGVLGQCTALAHLNLHGNQIGPHGAESLAGVLAQCPALAHLDLGCNSDFATDGAERLAGVLAQCSALAHLNLFNNQIGDAGAESLAGVLAQCPALAHLNLGANDIGSVGRGRLRGSWRGQASGLFL
jgi:Leucine-rich repeat (LRR) protein